MVYVADISVMQREHLLGIDQTDNLDLYYGGNKKIVELAKIDFFKERVLDGRFYLSKKANEYLVVQMFDGGHVYKVDANDYVLTASKENILVSSIKTGRERYLLDGDSPFWGNIPHLGPDNYTLMSSDNGRGFKGYPAVRFGNSYKKSLRVHHIIPVMDCGIEDVNVCVGDFRTHEIHHIKPFGKGGTNSIDNLVIKRKSDHEELHGYYRGGR